MGIVNVGYVGGPPAGMKLYNSNFDELYDYITGLSGLVAYYPMNETSGTICLDRSGNNLDGDITGATINQTGQVGPAYSFDGNDYIQNTNESSFDFERTNAFSIAALIKFTSTASDQVIFSKMMTSGDYTGYEVYIDGNGDKFTVFLLNDYSPANAIRVRGVTTLDNNFHFVVMTYDGSSTAAGVQLYVDGIIESNPTIINDNLSATMLNNMNPTIGSRQTGVYYSGLMQHLFVTNTVITTTEITKLARIAGLV